MSEVILLGDIGGTNSRFAVVERGALAPREERHYVNADFPSFRAAIEAYCGETGVRLDAGVVAIAGPVAGEIVGPTNLAQWRFSPPGLARELGIASLTVINDFEAVAHALPFLGAGQTQVIGQPEAGVVNGNMAVLGPGTGLGVGALVRARSGWTAVPSEGGHAEASAPPNERWAAAHALIERNVGRVSGEHVLSGPGLARIDAALSTLAGRARQWQPAAVGEAALAGDDAVAREAAALFFDYLARFSGDVALMFAAKGGLFLYGGVAQRLSSLLDAAAFRAAFEAKAPLGGFLQNIPTRLIMHPTPGLIGCAALAAGG